MARSYSIEYSQLRRELLGKHFMRGAGVACVVDLINFGQKLVELNNYLARAKAMTNEQFSSLTNRCCNTYLKWKKSKPGFSLGAKPDQLAELNDEIVGLLFAEINRIYLTSKRPETTAILVAAFERLTDELGADSIDFIDQIEIDDGAALYKIVVKNNNYVLKEAIEDKYAEEIQKFKNLS